MTTWINAVVGQRGEKAEATPDVDMRTLKPIKPRRQNKNAAYVLTDEGQRIYVWDVKVLKKLNALEVGTHVRVKTAYECFWIGVIAGLVRLCHVITALEVGERDPSQ